MNALIEYFISRSVFVNLLTLLLIFVGGYHMATMRREAFPNISFDVVIVTTIYPGASPYEIEKLVTHPIEEGIKEVDGIKEIRSSSIENRSGIVITIDPDTKEMRKVVDDIRSAVERTEDLPEDAEKPILLEITSASQPVIEISLGAKSENGRPLISERALRDQARLLEDKILELNSVAKIERRGWRDTEIQVDVDPHRLTGRYLSIDQIITALRNRNINFPGGEIADGLREIVVRTVGEFNSTTEISNVFVRSNDIGSGVRIRDIGTVREGFEDATILEKTQGEQAIALTVIKRESADAIKMVDDLMAVTEQFKKGAPRTINITYANDLSYFIRRRLGVLLTNGIQGLILVVISLFFFLGWRTSFMVALGIPVAMGTTFFVLSYMGMTLNLISMFGFIIVVGVLVDDAIIVSENFYRYLEEGYSTYDAAVKGVQEVVSPVLATVTTTIAAFAPLMFMTGIMGKFMVYIPLVIIVALTASLGEAFFLLPSHLHDINKYSKKLSEIKEEGNWFFRVRKKYYEPLLSKILHHRKIAMLSITGILVIALGLQIVFGRFLLFPDVIETFQIKVTTPTGYSLEYSDRFIRVIEEVVNGLPGEEVDTHVSRVGIIRKGANDPFTLMGNNYAQVMVFLTPEEKRHRNAAEIIEEIRLKTEWMLDPEILKKKREEAGEQSATREYTIPQRYQDLKGKLVGLEFEKLQGGPPVGKAIAIEIVGDDFEVMERIAEEYKSVIKTIPSIVDVDDDYEEGKDEIRIRINERLASQAGVSVAQIAMAVNAAYQGNVSTRIKRVDEEVDVRVRFNEKFRRSLKSLNEIYVMNFMGRLIPVSRLVSYDKTRGVTAINHLEGRRLITVTANVIEKRITSREANILIRKRSAEIPSKYPDYIIRFSGENKDTEESFASLGRSFLLGFVVIFMILASVFRSILQPFVVLAALPFALIGVILAFLIHGMPFSFMAIMGMIGLSGVVVNDSIVLVDFANNIRRNEPDLPLLDVVLRAGSMRLRAVILTTVTTVLGLLPTAYGIGGNDPFLIPMAMAFAWGLTFSTILTLLIVPLQYYLVERGKLLLKERLGIKER
jgi:multidrug efflux pump subunit AcrB